MDLHEKGQDCMENTKSLSRRQFLTGSTEIGNRALHIESCSKAGLGINDLAKIQHKKISL
jgi:hypothetical protein